MSILQRHHVAPDACRSQPLSLPPLFSHFLFFILAGHDRASNAHLLHQSFLSLVPLAWVPTVAVISIRGRHSLPKLLEHSALSKNTFQPEEVDELTGVRAPKSVAPCQTKIIILICKFLTLDSTQCRKNT